MTQQLPSGFFVDTEELPEGFTIDEAEEPSMIDKVGDFFTGSLRTTPDIERTPSLMESPGFFSDAPLGQAAKVAGLMALTDDPNELAQIITSTIPGTRIQYNKDAQGNTYPIVINNRGEAAIVDKPGIDMMNVGQFLGQAAAFAPAGRATSILGMGAKEAATQGAIELAQEQAGGFEPNTMNIVMAGGLGGTGKALENVVGAAFRGATGSTKQVDDVIQAGEEFNVPVMTTDAIPPETRAGSLAQSMAETIPFVGTGQKRAEQQKARIAATDKFIEQYQGGTYTQIIQGLRDKKDKIKKAAAKTYESINPRLSNQGPIQFEASDKAIEDAFDLFNTPGRETDPAALDLLVRMQETIEGEGQIFQTVKDNIGAWHNKIDAIDSPLTSNKDIAELKKVLSAMRRDRDSFARKNLSSNDYRRLKNADVAHGEMANELKKTKTKGMLDKGDVTPEIAKQALFSTKKSDIDRLFKDLTPEGRNNARSIIIQEISETLRKKVGGEGLNPSAMANELRKKAKTLDVFFRGAERRQLNGFLRIIEHTRQAQKASVTTVTGQQIIPFLAVGSGQVSLGIPAAYASVGALGRLYERPEIRSIVARMSSIPPGSTEFERMANILQQTIQAGAQAGKDDQ